MASSKIINFLSLLLAFVLLFSSQAAARELASTTYPALGRSSTVKGRPYIGKGRPCTKKYGCGRDPSPPRRCPKIYGCRDPPPPRPN